MGVNVEGRRPQETDKRLIALPRELHGETRRRGNGSHDWNPGSERFLHDLE